MISPELSLRDATLDYLSQKLNKVCKVYRTLPAYDENIPYPFVNFGTLHSVNSVTQDHVLDTLHITYHVWADSDDDTRFYQILDTLHDAGSETYDADGYTFAGIISQLDQQVIPDNSTGTMLLHGIVTLVFRFI